jgi:hypothetical protein
LSKREHYLPESEESLADIWLNWNADPVVSKRSLEFVKALRKDDIWGLLEQGKKYAQVMEERGDFKLIPRRVAAVDSARDKLEISR